MGRTFGITHFCAALFLNNSNQCEEGEEEEGGSWPALTPPKGDSGVNIPEGEEGT